MLKKERARLIEKILDEYFPHPPISLDHINPYTLLVAIILSAQSTDARVNAITPELFKIAPTPQKMLKNLTVKKLENIIKPCGLAPTKAKSIWRMSEQLIDQYQGKVPKTFEELEKLPGVGHKTAAVLLSQAFNIPALAVDTHVHRCAKRWKLSSGKNVKQTEADLQKLFAPKNWGKLHLQIIYFARLYCPARGHNPDTCPICSVIFKRSRSTSKRLAK
jgi:endonuclease III